MSTCESVNESNSVYFSCFHGADAKGSGRFVLPKEAGYLMNSERRFIVMQNHYDNPSRIPGLVDRSGVRLYYTDTMRENEAGTLLLGDGSLFLEGQRVKSNFDYGFTCPTDCTRLFPESVNLFGSFLHMHLTGKEIYTNKFSANGTFLANLNKVRNSSNFLERMKFFTGLGLVGFGTF